MWELNKPLCLERIAFKGVGSALRVGDGGGHMSLYMQGLPTIAKIIDKTKLYSIRIPCLCKEERGPWVGLGYGFRTRFLIV